MRVIARVDQLRVDAYVIARALNASFYDIRDPQLLRDLPQIARNALDTGNTEVLLMTSKSAIFAK